MSSSTYKMTSDVGSKLPIVALYFFLLLIPLTYAGRIVSDTKYAEVQEHLKRLNKPPVKSIQSPDGDIIDCIPATHQPAFDEPLLKNHVFQMRPSSDPEGYEDNEESISQMWHDAKEECPDGTVAIIRIKEEDLLRASSIQEYGTKKYISDPQLNTTGDFALPAMSTHEYAVVGLKGKAGYHGTQASIGLWQPEVMKNVNEFSLAQLWLISGSYARKDLNSIEVGWQIYKRLYGDFRPRLFVFWTRNAYMGTGCYNLNCRGFVQTSKTVVVGGALSPISVYNGTEHAITILVWKDKGSGNWWLKIGGENVGYWPSALFTRMGKGATEVQWGGEIVNSKSSRGRHTTTDMGSGHFAEEGNGKAASFKNVKTINGTDTLTNVTAFSSNYITNSACYNLKKGMSDDDGTYFFYGGSGRNPSCP